MRTLTIVTLTMFAFGAQAQIDFGGKVGVNYHYQSSSLSDNAPSGSTDVNSNDGPGFHAGVFFGIDLSDKFYFRPEVLYSTRHSRAQLSSSLSVGGVTTKVDQEVKGTLSYVEVPLLLGFRVSDKLSLHAGPGLGVLAGNAVKVTGTQTVTIGGQTVTTSLDDRGNLTEGLRPLEVAAVVGLGYRTENGLDLGLRYWRGLTTVEDNSDLSKTFQNVFQLSIGYAFLRN